jgi:hypothetical protein
MKEEAKELFKTNGFVEEGLMFKRELTSPVNPEAKAKITISLFLDEYSATVENYYGKGINNYSGSQYYTFKSAKRLISRLSKDCDFYGF